MMKRALSALSGVIVSIGVAGPLHAQAPEDNMARCQQLYSIWARHNATSAYGKVLDADMALEQCRKGQYSAGVAQLKQVLQRQQLPVPPVETATTPR
jgi:hypothetical protein